MPNSKNITFDQLQSALTRVKNSLDKKANTSHGNHVPKTETANNARFLRNDNTWQTITPVNIGAADRSHNHTSLTGVTSLQFAAASSDHATIKVTTDGGSAANTYLDFEMDDDSNTDMFRWRFNAWDADASAATGQFNLMTLTAKDTTSARLTVNGDVTASSFTGNASSATKLQTARALKIGNTSKNFDGTGNITWTLSEIGAAASSHGTHVTYATAVPLADGTAAVGTSSKVAREDHVHPIQTTVTGNAGTATKLQTARTLTIGNKGKAFDGSANVTWTLSEIGAAATGHTHNKISSRGKVAAEATTTRPAVDGISMSEVYDNGYPTTYGNVITLKGQGDGQILVGWSGNSGGHAPVYVRSKRDVADANWSGWAQFYTSANPQTSVSGNAGTATKLQTGRTLTIGNTGKTFDGSRNVSWTLSEIGAAASSHSHNYVPLNNGGSTTILADSDASTTTEYAQLQAGHNYLRVTSSGGGGTATQGADKLTFNGNVVYHAGRKPSAADIGALPLSGGTMTGPITSSFVSSTWLEGSQGRALLASNAGSGSYVALLRSVSNNGYFTLSSYQNNIYLNYQSKASVDAGTNSATKQASLLNESGDTSFPGTVTASSFSGSLSGNASSATKLANARNIKIGNTSRSFNGTADVTWTLSDIGAASSGHNHGLLHNNFTVSVANTTTDNGWSMINSNYNGYLLKSIRSNANAPAWLQGNYSAGIAFGGEDTKGVMSLAYNSPSIRFAGGNGTKPVWYITIDGTSGKTYNMDSLTANTANTATKLATARTLTIGNTGKTFDGSGNVSWSLSEIGAAASNHGHSNMLTFKSNHAGDWTDVTSMSDKVYMGGWHGNITDTTKNKGYISLGIESSKSLDVYLDGDYYANENNLVLNTGNYKSYVTPANIGAANASHGTHVTYGGNGSATTVSRSDHTHSYIPLGGSSSITGNLEFSNSGTTVRGVIGTMGDNDHWRIVGGATASNSGYLEIATADDASEPIYVRQYGSGKFGTLTRTATLLDASGNTSFPGTVAASGFSGNATSATRLQTARSINGTSFNGTGDITTANWGTARTITIGNTGKSVNGGGNVNWSIDEIGALKASKICAADANVLKTTGRYIINGIPTNVPTNNHGVIDVIWGIGTPYQIFYPDNVNTAYKRTWNNSNSTWNGWTQLKFTDTWRGVQNNLTSDATDQSLSAAQGKALKGLIDGKAASSHGHNYLSVKGINTITSTTNDTTVNWGAQNNSVHWYTGAGQLNGQPSQWGYLVNIGQDSEVHQVWMTQSSGDLLHRGGNGSGWNGSWRTILDSSNYSTWAAAKNHTHNYAASSHTHNYAGSSSAGGNANAAVKLATARSINGTNFDGSGNITTANWGTARTITIGGTGKSVNGSGNVSWSLSEIGALPIAGGTVSGNLNVAGAFSIGGKKITINSSAPSSPAVGDIWIKI